MSKCYCWGLWGRFGGGPWNQSSSTISIKFFRVSIAALTGNAGYGACCNRWCCGIFGPSSAFSSSRRFRQAAFGFKFLSKNEISTIGSTFLGSSKTLSSPLTCCSSVIITSTAILRIPSFVCGLSDLRCDMHILPNSLRASLISRILILLMKKSK